MGEREASVKLTLDDGQFVVAIRKAGDETARTATRGNRAMAVLGAGVANVKRSFIGLGTSIAKTGLLSAKLATTLALGSAAKSAVDLDARIKNLAFRMQSATGATVDFRDVQKTLETAAGNTSRKTEEMATAFETVFGATKDAKFAAAALEPIGKVATATGADVNQLANLAQVLNRRFGVGAEGIEEALAQAFEKLSGGGKSIEELGPKFAKMAIEAEAAGFKGQRGAVQLLGILEKVDAKVGETADVGFKELFRVLKEGSSQVKSFEKATKFKFTTDTTALEKIRELLQAPPEIRKRFQETLTGDVQEVFKELTKGGLAGFDKRMKDAGKTTLTAAKIQEVAAKRAADPQARLREATQKLTTAMGQPEVINAIEKLAESLPKLAKVLAQVVEFAAKNPLLAGGAAVGGKAAIAFAGGSLAAAGKTVGTGAAGAIKAGAPGIGSAIGKNIALPAGAPTGPTRPGVAVAAGAAAVGVAAAASQAGKLKKELGVETDLSDLVLGFKGGEFSLENVFEDVIFSPLEGLKRRGETIAKTAIAAGSSDNRATRKAREKSLERAKEDARKFLAARGLTPEQAAAGQAPSKATETSVKNASAIGIATADQISGRTLNVKVVNAADLKGGDKPTSGGGSRGTLTPPPTSAGAGAR